MGEKKWRGGIVGLGGIAPVHMNHLNAMDRTEITAVCDVNASVLEEAGNRLGLAAARRFSDFEELIRDPNVDFVVSAVSNKYHYAIIKACIAAGKPIMSEKPFTRTMEEAEELMEMHKRNPIPCVIGFSYRYVPAFRYVKQIMMDGKLGRIRHFHAHYLQEENVPLFNHPFTWRFSKDQAGSGVLGDIGSHMIDAARYFVGEFKSVHGIMSTFVESRIDPRSGVPIRVDVDDYASFQGVLGDGVMGTFHTHKNALGTGNEFRITIYGDLGTADFCVEQPREVRVMLRSDPLLAARMETVQVGDAFNRRLLEDFIRYIDDPLSVEVPTLLDGYRNQCVMQMVLDSAESGIMQYRNEWDLTI